MRFKTLSLLSSAALLAAPLATASAAYNIGNPTNVCGGDLFTFCVAITGAQGTGTNSANFFITIVNEALNGSNAAPYNTLSITSLGFDGFGAAPIIFASSAGTSFVASNNLTDLSNFPGTWVGAASAPPPVHNGLLFQESITFEFLNTTASTFTSDLALHAQAGPGSCSGKMEINLSGGTLPPNGPNFISTGCGGTVTSTPEPASLALMGTGLFGLVGFARRRRQS